LNPPDNKYEHETLRRQGGPYEFMSFSAAIPLALFAPRLKQRR
jgi:hypothetical protein